MHLRDDELSGCVLRDEDGWRSAKVIEMLTEQTAVEHGRRLRDVGAREVGAAVVADLGAHQIELATTGQSIVLLPLLLDRQGLRREQVHIAGPDLATAEASCASMSW